MAKRVCGGIFMVLWGRFDGKKGLWGHFSGSLGGVLMVKRALGLFFMKAML